MKKILIFLLVAGALVAAWFLFRKSSATPDEETKTPSVARVETTLLRNQEIAQTVTAFGVVAPSPSGDLVITAPFDCLIRKVHVVPGARVAAGDVLLEISPTPDAQLQLDAARSALSLAGKALAAAQERYDLKLATSQELLAAPQAELDARQKLTSFENRGLGAEGRITAAAAGVVSKLDLSAGALATAGTALVTVTGESQLEVRLGVEAAETAQIHAGQTVTLFSANRNDAQPINSTVRITGSNLDALTGAAEVRVPVPAGALLLLGEHVKAAVEVMKKTALVVPRSAVLPAEGKYELYTVKNGRAVRHEIAPGIGAGDLVEVSSADLHAGDIVVRLGNYELTDGMAVQQEETKQPADKDKSAQEATP